MPNYDSEQQLRKVIPKAQFFVDFDEAGDVMYGSYESAESTVRSIDTVSWDSNQHELKSRRVY